MNGPSYPMEIPKNPLRRCQCELNEISFMKLNLVFKFITKCVFTLFLSIAFSNTLTVLSDFEAVTTS